MIKYSFKEGPVTIKNKSKADPQIIGTALGKIAEQYGGNLTPKAVVDAARNSRHPLHKHFEWDDALAAEAFRLEQARTIIRIIHVEDAKTETGTAAAFYSIADKGGVAYRTHDEVKNSAALQIIIMQQATRDLEAWERRYREITDVCEMVRGARMKLQEKQSKIETRKAA